MKKIVGTVASVLVVGATVVFVLELFEYSYFVFKWIEFREGVNATTSELASSIVLIVVMGFSAAIGLWAATSALLLSDQKLKRKIVALLVWCVGLRLCLIFVGLTLRLGNWPDSLLTGKTPSIVSGGIASILVLLIWRKSRSR